jgi:hypothetical protein
MIRTSAILAVSSMNRYVEKTPGSMIGSVSLSDNGLYELYTGTGSPGNNFQLQSPGAFIYGYISRIAVSQVQIEYRVPTVVPSNLIFGGVNENNNPSLPQRIGNDHFVLFVPTITPANPMGNPFDQTQYRFIQLPYGFYVPNELSTILQAILSDIPALSNMTVTYNNAGTGNIQPGPDFGSGFGNSFTFSTLPSSQEFFFVPVGNVEFTFNGVQYNTNILKDVLGYNPSQITCFLKTYRLLGVHGSSVNFLPVNVYQTTSPNFLFTPYIDICSTSLTKFQRIKDTDTSTYRRASLIARGYLSGISYQQGANASYGLGTEPFIITADLNTAKIIKWSKDETIYNLDFQLYDQYGDSLFWEPQYPTEFQITLLCEEDEY